MNEFRLPNVDVICAPTPKSAKMKYQKNTVKTESLKIITYQIGAVFFSI